MIRISPRATLQYMEIMFLLKIESESDSPLAPPTSLLAFIDANLNRRHSYWLTPGGRV